MSAVISGLKNKSYELRKRVLDMCVKAQTGHVTSSLSSVDIMVALYYGGVLKYDPENRHWDGRDRFILSKGQASPLLYAVLADVGFYDTAELDRFAQQDGIFGVHLQWDVPGVELTSGSLGHGFGVAAGIALGAIMDRELFMTFTLLGDGECYEGSIWETAMFAAHNNLNNLVAIVDRNYLCVTDFTENIVALEPMEDKWRACGWNVKRVNGHSIKDILEALEFVRSRRSHKPLVLIADTVKGEGIDCLTNDPIWHGQAPRGRDAERARVCLLTRQNDE
ncbi:MAG: transketolase [Candidatus Magnetominusculus sp. LBB02]|nr:transketolase [Candidatus Magnetominusculus sp. LBB02]